MLSLPLLCLALDFILHEDYPTFLPAKDCYVSQERIRSCIVQTERELPLKCIVVFFFLKKLYIINIDLLESWIEA